MQPVALQRERLEDVIVRRVVDPTALKLLPVFRIISFLYCFRSLKHTLVVPVNFFCYKKNCLAEDSVDQESFDQKC